MLIAPNGCDPWRTLLAPLRDFLEHDLRSAAADRQHAGVAYHSFDRALLDVAEPAVELLAGVHHLVHELAGKGLEHGYFADRIGVAAHSPGGVVEKLPRRLDLGL